MRACVDVHSSLLIHRSFATPPWQAGIRSRDVSAVLDPADDSFDAEAWLRRKEREHAREVSAAPFSQSVSQSQSARHDTPRCPAGPTRTLRTHAETHACSQSHGHMVTRSHGHDLRLRLRLRLRHKNPTNIRAKTHTLKLNKRRSVTEGARQLGSWALRAGTHAQWRRGGEGGGGGPSPSPCSVRERTATPTIPSSSRRPSSFARLRLPRPPPRARSSGPPTPSPRCSTRGPRAPALTALLSVTAAEVLPRTRRWGWN